MKSDKDGFGNCSRLLGTPRNMLTSRSNKLLLRSKCGSYHFKHILPESPNLNQSIKWIKTNKNLEEKWVSIQVKLFLLINCSVLNRTRNMSGIKSTLRCIYWRVYHNLGLTKVKKCVSTSLKRTFPWNNFIKYSKTNVWTESPVFRQQK